MITIDFPKDEILDLTKRLRQGMPIYTLRVDREQGKYKSGQLVNVDFWEGPLKIFYLKTIEDVKQYKFYNEMEDEWIKQVEGKIIDVLGLMPV